MKGTGVIYEISGGDIVCVLDTIPEMVEVNTPKGCAFLHHEAINPDLTETHRVRKGVLVEK